MKLLTLSLLCSAVLGIIVAVFLRVKKIFDRKYDEFEDERHRAVVGSLHGKYPSPKDQQ